MSSLKIVLIIVLAFSAALGQVIFSKASLCSTKNCAVVCRPNDALCNEQLQKLIKCKESSLENKCQLFYASEKMLKGQDKYTTDIYSLWDQCNSDKNCVEEVQQWSFFKEYYLKCKESCIKKGVPPKIDGKKWFTKKEFLNCQKTGCDPKKTACTNNAACKLIMDQQDALYNKGAEQVQQCYVANHNFINMMDDTDMYPYGHHTCLQTIQVQHTPENVLYTEYNKCVGLCEAKDDTVIDETGPDPKQIQNCLDLNCPIDCPPLTTLTCSKDLGDFTKCYSNTVGTQTFCDKFETGFQDRLKKGKNLSKAMAADWEKCFTTCGKSQDEKGFFSQYIVGCKNQCVTKQQAPAPPKEFMKIAEVKKCRTENCKKLRDVCVADVECKKSLDQQVDCLEKSQQCLKAIKQYSLAEETVQYPYGMHACDMTCLPTELNKDQMFGKYGTCYKQCEFQSPVDPEEIDPEKVEKQEFTYKDVEECIQKYSTSCPKASTPAFNQKCIDERDRVMGFYDKSKECEKCRNEIKALTLKEGSINKILYPKSCGVCWEKIPLTEISSQGKEFLVAPIQECTSKSKVTDRQKFYSTTILEWQKCQGNCKKCPLDNQDCITTEKNQNKCIKDAEVITDQCKLANLDFDARKPEEMWPLSMMVCRSSCTVSGNPLYDEIQQCNQECNDAGKRTEFSWMKLKLCLQKYSPQGFQAGSVAKEEKDKLDGCIGISGKSPTCKKCDGLFDTEEAVNIASQRVFKECQQCALTCITSVDGKSENFKTFVSPAYKDCFEKGDYVNTAIKISATKKSSAGCQKEKCDKMTQCDGDKCKQDLEKFGVCQNNLQCTLAKKILDEESKDESIFPYIAEVCRAACIEDSLSLPFREVQDCRKTCNRETWQPEQEVLRKIHTNDILKLCLKEYLATPSKTLQPKTFQNAADLKDCIATGNYKKTEGEETKILKVEQCAKCNTQLEADDKLKEKLGLPLDCEKCALECIKQIKFGDITDTYTEYVALPYSDCYSTGTREKQDTNYQKIGRANLCIAVECSQKCEGDCAKDAEIFKKCEQGTDDAQGQCVEAAKLDTKDNEKIWPLAKEICKHSCLPEAVIPQFKMNFQCEQNCHTKVWEKPPVELTFTFRQVKVCIDSNVPKARTEKDKTSITEYNKCLAENALLSCDKCRKITGYINSQPTTDEVNYYRECQECESTCIKKQSFDSDLIAAITQNCITDPKIKDEILLELIPHKASKKQAEDCRKTCAVCEAEACKADQKEYDTVCRAQLQCTIGLGMLTKATDEQLVPFPTLVCHASCSPLPSASEEWKNIYKCHSSCGLTGEKDQTPVIPRKSFTYTEADNCINTYCYKPLVDKENGFYLLWENLETCKSAADFKDCQDCLADWNKDKTTSMLVKCEKCLNECNTKLKKSVKSEEIYKYDQFIGGCQSQCVETATFNQKETITATKSSYTKCIDVMIKNGKIRKEGEHYEKYNTCVMTSEQCKKANILFGDIKDEATRFPQYKLNCHDACTPYLYSIQFYESYLWERHCMTVNDNELDDEIFTNFKLSDYDECKKEFLPACSPEDKACVFLKNLFETCFEQKVSTEQTQIESCFYCKTYLDLKVQDSKFPKVCGKCTQECLKEIRADTSSEKFKKLHIPALEQCSLDAKIKIKIADIKATKGSNEACLTKNCVKFDDCSKEEGEEIKRTTCKDLVDKFANCDKISAQCVYSKEKLNLAKAVDLFPYSSLICFESCATVQETIHQYKNSISCKRQCMTESFTPER